MNRINDFQLDEEKALAYFAHIRNNCMAYLAGVECLIIKLIKNTLRQVKRLLRQVERVKYE
jgi:hypothetical protein